MKQTDQELINETLSGQREAFGQLVGRYQQRIIYSLMRLLRTQDDALDVAQEAFLLAYQKLDTFRGDANFYSWLFRIAYHCAMNHHRRTKTVVSLDQVREDSGIDPVEMNGESQVGMNMELQEDLELLQASVDELSQEHREIITLKDLNELSYEEIAQILECPIGTVRSRLHRARLELRSLVHKKMKASDQLADHPRSEQHSERLDGVRHP